MRCNRVCSIVVCLVLAILPLAGCNKGKQYQALSGTVTVDGAPLKNGLINFFPVGEGTAAGGQIKDGTFELGIESGPTPGNYRVEITGSRPTGKKEFDIDLKQEVDVEEQFLPPRYNLKSELTCEVVAGGENKFDFPLRLK